MKSISGTSGFTLVEMLAVVTIIAILAGASVTGITKAREIARRTRAEAEAREMVNAWLQYFDLYKTWPNSVAGKNKVDATYKVLGPITDPQHGDNPKGIVLFNLTERTGSSAFLDPWGTPYQLSFAATKSEVHHDSILVTSVAFPFRKRHEKEE